MYLHIIWFELTAFVCSLLALPVIRKSPYLRIYPVLLLVVVSVEGYFNFFARNPGFNAPVYNVQVPLQYVCYLLIFYFAAQGTRIKRFMATALAILVIVNVITAVFFTPQKFNNVWGYFCSSVLAIIGIVLIFYEMVVRTSSRKYDFLRDPFFYMLLAFLFFNLVTLPYFGMAEWIYHSRKNDNYRDIYQSLVDIMSIMNYLLYSTYSIAFVWMVRKKDIY